jgi:hypothetical protein
VTERGRERGRGGGREAGTGSSSACPASLEGSARDEERGRRLQRYGCDSVGGGGV